MHVADTMSYAGGRRRTFRASSFFLIIPGIQSARRSDAIYILRGVAQSQKTLHNFAFSYCSRGQLHPIDSRPPAGLQGRTTYMSALHFMNLLTATQENKRPRQQRREWRVGRTCRPARHLVDAGTHAQRVVVAVASRYNRRGTTFFSNALRQLIVRHATRLTWCGLLTIGCSSGCASAQYACRADEMHGDAFQKPRFRSLFPFGNHQSLRQPKARYAARIPVYEFIEPCELTGS